MTQNPGDKRPINSSSGHQVVQFAAKSIPLFSGRPKRETIIGRDDLMDLDILLHTCACVEDFVAKV